MGGASGYINGRFNMILFGVSDNELDDSLSLAASDAEELSGSVTDPALLPSSASRNARLRADEYRKGTVIL